MDAASGEGAASPPLALIDTHCHLDDPAFAADRDAVIAASRGAGVSRWVNVGFNPRRWQSTIELANTTDGMWLALGLHPLHAEEWSDATREELRTLLQRSNAVAIGEIGLDFARGRQNREVQRRAFDQQLALGMELGLPVIIHQRAAETDLAEMLSAYPPEHPLLLHSFDAEGPLAEIATERGYAIGVGGLATRPSKNALRDRIERVPLRQLVLESDAPYLVPRGVTAERNVPANVATVARFLADLRGISMVEVARTTSDSAAAFLNRDPAQIWMH